MADPTTAEKLACARRELAMRKSAYPGWIERGKMTAEKAAYELALMQAIARDYEALLESEKAEARALRNEVRRMNDRIEALEARQKELFR